MGKYLIYFIAVLFLGLCGKVEACDPENETFPQKSPHSKASVALSQSRTNAAQAQSMISLRKDLESTEEILNMMKGVARQPSRVNPAPQIMPQNKKKKLTKEEKNNLKI